MQTQICTLSYSFLRAPKSKSQHTNLLSSIITEENKNFATARKKMHEVTTKPKKTCPSGHVS